MQKDSEHLNFDLAFLDDDGTQAASAQPTDTRYKRKWKNIAVIGTIVTVIGGVIFLGSNSSPQYTPTASYPQPAATPDAIPDPQEESSDAGDVRVGQFTCSNSDSSEADRLAPTDNLPELTDEQSALNARGQEIQELKAQIDASATTNESSQAEIDDYNAMVNKYNSTLSTYKADAAALETRIDAFNAQVEAHNNYLVAHCARNGR